MATQTRVIGPISAYAIAVQEGYTGSKAEWAEEIGNAQANAQAAQEAADRAQSLTESLPEDFDDVVENFAPLYSSLTLPVPAGTYCTHNGVLYRANTTIASGEAWTQAHWIQVDVSGELGDLKSAIDDIKHLRNVTEINSGYLHPGTVTSIGKIQSSTNNKHYVIYGSDAEGDDAGYYNCDGLAGGKISVSINTIYTTSVTVYFCNAKPNAASNLIESHQFTESGEYTIPTGAKYISIAVISVSGTGSGVPDSQRTTVVGIRSVLFKEYLDNNLTSPDYPPSAKAVGDAIAEISGGGGSTPEEVQELKDTVDLLASGNQMLDIVAAYQEISPTFEGFSVGYSVGTNGSIGATQNTRYFAFKTSPLLRYNISSCTKIIITFEPEYVQTIRYAFSSTADTFTLVGEVVTVTVSGESKLEFVVPAGAKYINVGGYGTSTANAALAAESTYVYGICSYFVGKLDDTLTAADKPAQAKAAGDRLTALETLNDTTGVRRFRLSVNDYNIPFSVKTGQTNLYVGYGSGGDNTEDRTGETEWERDNGFYNTALGVQAFANNVDGDHCTAVGFTALKSNTTGDFNTCVGEDALFGNTTGSDNIAIGDHAGQNNNGSNNILIGARVMRPATNASNNIIIGKEAGSVLATGGNNIIIGNSLNPAADSSNNLIIGNSSINNIVIAGKVISFNQDGTVTWSNPT